jgi:hypothetical protein
VVLTDPGTGGVRVFEAGDELTDWAVGMIDNPEVLGEPEETPADPKPKTARRPRKAPTK